MNILKVLTLIISLCCASDGYTAGTSDLRLNVAIPPTTQLSKTLPRYTFEVFDVSGKLYTLQSPTTCGLKMCHITINPLQFVSAKQNKRWLSGVLYVYTNNNLIGRGGILTKSNSKNTYVAISAYPDSLKHIKLN